MQAQVVQLPTELARLRESDRLVQRWLEIQGTLEGEEKVVALFEWRQDMQSHKQDFAF